MTNSPGKPNTSKTTASEALSGSDSQAHGEGTTDQPARRAAGERFPRSMRLRAKGDFDDLFQRGEVVVDQVLVIHGRPAPHGGKLGISISKRVGNAPCRNRWKRLIREAYRRLAPRSPAVQRVELVIRPRRGAQPSYTAIERSLASLTARLDRQLSRQDRT